jgi:hypothetical protein
LRFEFAALLCIVDISGKGKLSNRVAAAAAGFNLNGVW